MASYWETEGSTTGEKTSRNFIILCTFGEASVRRSISNMWIIQGTTETGGLSLCPASASIWNFESFL